MFWEKTIPIQFKFCKVDFCKFRKKNPFNLNLFCSYSIVELNNNSINCSNIDSRHMIIQLNSAWKKNICLVIIVLVFGYYPEH